MKISKMQTKDKYIPALDGIRAMAIFFVMLGHSVQQAPLIDGTVVDRGGLGVDVFFVLSGYLITTILFNEIARNGTVSLKKFYMRRFLRLYPAMVILVIAYLIISPFLLQQTFSTRILTSMAVMTYTMNWVKALSLGGGGLLAHTWSLSIEEQFYLFWPIVLIFMVRFFSMKFCAFVALLISFFSLFWSIYLDFNGASPERIYNGLDTRVHSIMIGCSLALWYLSGIENFRKDRLISIRSIIALAIIFYIMIVGTSPAIRELSHLLLSVSTAALILSILNEEILITKFLGISTLCIIGRISYGIYLWHYPVFTIMHLNRMSDQRILIFGSAISITIALVSYLSVERYFLSLKLKFRS